MRLDRDGEEEDGVGWKREKAGGNGEEERRTWILSLAVHPNINNPIVGPKHANSAGTNLLSCARSPFFRMSGMR